MKIYRIRRAGVHVDTQRVRDHESGLRRTHGHIEFLQGAIPSEGMVPAFEIGLRIINPNSQALNLDGIVYTVSLQGYELVKGVGKDFPVIEGYSEGEVKLTASANLLAGIRFVGDMMQSKGGYG